MILSLTSYNAACKLVINTSINYNKAGETAESAHCINLKCLQNKEFWHYGIYSWWGEGDILEVTRNYHDIMAYGQRASVVTTPSSVW